MVGWILLGLFLLLVVYLLTAPVWLEIDSTKGFLRARFHRLLIFTLTLSGESVNMEMRFLGIRKKIRTGFGGEAPAGTVASGTKHPLKEGHGKSRAKRFPLKKLLAVIRSFRIRELVLHLDTGNQPLNGILYPLAEWVRWHTKHDVRISFTGESKLIFRVRNNLLRMLWAYVRA